MFHDLVTSIKYYILYIYDICMYYNILCTSLQSSPLCDLGGFCLLKSVRFIYISEILFVFGLSNRVSCGVSVGFPDVSCLAIQVHCPPSIAARESRHFAWSKGLETMTQHEKNNMQNKVQNKVQTCKQQQLTTINNN